jgi:hypothetical protein
VSGYAEKAAAENAESPSNIMRRSQAQFLRIYGSE